MIKYTVNEKERTVQAEITGCKDDMVRRIKKLAHADVTSGAERLEIANNFSVTVKCHPDDTFDENIGKAIAKKRLLNKYHTACSKALHRFENSLPKFDECASNEIQRILKILREHQ